MHYDPRFSALPAWLQPANYEGTPEQVRFYKATLQAIYEFTRYYNHSPQEEIRMQIKGLQNIPLKFFLEHGWRRTSERKTV